MRGAAFLLACVVAFAPAGVAAHASRELPRIAILDSGIRASHQEFDTARGQIAAWWDFTADRAPLHAPPPGAMWDPLVPAPYDPRGHGTAVAALAAGLHPDPSAARAFCPGCPLVIGKVIAADGSATPAAVAAGIRWATQDAGARIVSLSITFSVAGVGVVPGALVELDEAIREATERGAIVVVAAGNGHLNRGIPGHASWMTAMGHSPDALVVGAASADGGSLDAVRFSADPDVVAHGIDVRVASAGADDAYVVLTGSSLAAPRVAGMAARLLDAAARVGCPLDPPSAIATLRANARDTWLPPTLEGAGILGSAELDAALGIVARCGDPGALPPATAAHAATVQALRRAASG